MMSKEIIEVSHPESVSVITLGIDESPSLYSPHKPLFLVSEASKRSLPESTIREKSKRVNRARSQKKYPIFGDEDRFVFFDREMRGRYHPNILWQNGIYSLITSYLREGYAIDVQIDGNGDMVYGQDHIDLLLGESAVDVKVSFHPKKNGRNSSSPELIRAADCIARELYRMYCKRREEIEELNVQRILHDQGDLERRVGMYRRYRR